MFVPMLKCLTRVPTFCEQTFRLLHGPLSIGDTSVSPVDTVHDLVVYVDADVSMTAYYHHHFDSMLCSNPADMQCAVFTVA